LKKNFCDDDKNLDKKTVCNIIVLWSMEAIETTNQEGGLAMMKKNNNYNNNNNNVTCNNILTNNTSQSNTSQSNTSQLVCRFCPNSHNVELTYEYIPLCENCSRGIPRCLNCGRIIMFAYNRIEDRYGNWLCLECAQDYRRCPICNRFIHSRHVVFDGEEFICPECSAIMEPIEDNEYIKNYGYKPQPRYYGDFQKDLLLGVELEVDNGGEDHRKAKRLLQIVNGSEDEKFIYVKHDGSLTNGFEVVSHPATLYHHIHVIPWQDAFEYLRSNGYDSDDTSTCGLHIHINRLFLGRTYRSIVTVEARLLFFVETFWKQLVKLSRRTEYQLSRWCARYETTDYELALEYNQESRYFALNFQNRATIEFRIFKGTLEFDVFEATLRLVDNIVRYCKKYGRETIKSKGWCGFVNFIIERGAKEHETLIKYMTKQGV